MHNFPKSLLLISVFLTLASVRPSAVASFSIDNLDENNAELMQTALRLVSLRKAVSQEVNFSPRNQRVLSSDIEQPITLQDVATNLYVISGDDRIINRYDSDTGAFLSTFATSSFAPIDLTFGGSNGNLFVTDAGSINAVLQFAKDTGAYLGPFTASGPSSTLVNPVGLTFGPNGNLFVANAGTNSGTGNIEQFDGSTGALVGVFASRGQSSFRPGEILFSDGYLFAADGATNSILRFNETTGAFIDAFASGGGLSGPSGFAFGPGQDGNLFVTSSGTNSIIQYERTTGALIGTFATGNGLNNPGDIAFGVDNNLYVSNTNGNNILRFDSVNGTFLGEFVAAGSGGLSGPFGIAFAPAPIPEPAIGSIFSTLGALGLSLTWSRVKRIKKRSSL